MDSTTDERTTKSESFLRKDSLKFKNDSLQRGVIYISRIPPFMKPNRCRSIFEQYGEVTKLFLSEEDINSRKYRKLHGGNGSKQFKEGWIEYSDKSVAKSVAESLNGQRIGGLMFTFSDRSLRAPQNYFDIDLSVCRVRYHPFTIELSPYFHKHRPLH